MNVKSIVVVAVGIVVAAAGGICEAGRSVVYEVEGTAYEGYFAGPAGAPLLLLVHDWDGLTDYEIRRAEMLAEQGYAVFAADLFGKGVRPATTEEKQALTGALYGDRKKMRTLLDAAFREGAVQGGDPARAVVFGYCFGGAAVLEMASSGADAKGFVSFHGGLSTPDGQGYDQVKGFVLVFHGTADTAVPMTEFAALAGALEEAGVAHEMTVYGGAPHAFTVFGSDRYREDADRKSWERFVGFLKQTL